jgi:molybdopterin molybdotransferase
MIPVGECAGRILAEDVSAPGDQPPFANSSMDGFAVRAGDVGGATPGVPVTLVIVADIPAGAPSQARVEAGQAARIMTGAPLPEGADAVVPVEDTSFAATPALVVLAPGERVAIHQAVRPGAYVRPRGQDFRQGQVLLERGRRLQPQDVGVLASIGQALVRVHRRPRVALFSSGDELAPPGQPLGPGQIYDANQYVLAAMLEQAGAEVLRLGTARDDPAQIAELLEQAVAAGAGLLVSSAGVSVGAFDYVRQVIEARGALSFWRVNMRPGKPLAFGTFAGVPFIGLPGNPVSAFVGCRVFVLPAVFKQAGRARLFPPAGKAVLAESVESDGRESYLRAVVEAGQPNGQRQIRLAGHQGSGNLFGLTQANALLIVPSGVKSLPSGSEINFWFLEVE